jgi:hypothetical protein
LYVRNVVKWVIPNQPTFQRANGDVNLLLLLLLVIVINTMIIYDHHPYLMPLGDIENRLLILDPSEKTPATINKYPSLYSFIH